MEQYTIDIFAEVEVDEALSPLMHRAIVATLQHQGVTKAPIELSLLLEGDDAVQALNKQYRGLDKTTDILSFASEDEIVEGTPCYLGDLIISVPQATRQSTHFKHALAEEMQLLVVHGTLHLLGYDHATAEEQAEMWAIQAEILTGIGCAVTVPQLME